MRGLNKVQIIGRLGGEPESRQFDNGGSVTNISVATSEKWTDKTTGEPKELTEWHKIVFFGKLAEIASQYLRKGGQVYVEGKLRTRKWTDKDGVDRYTTEIVADQLQMLDSAPQGQEAPQGQPQSQPQTQQAPQGQPQADDTPSKPEIPY